MNRKIVSFLSVISMLIMVMIIAVNTGSIKVPLLELFQGLMDGTHHEVEIIKDLRFPRIIVALFAGAALAVSGALLQAVMKNPLADAGVIGISSGSAFFSILLVTIAPQLFFWMPLFSFIGGALACFLVYTLSWKSGLNPLRLILVGIAINATFTGLNDSFNFRGSYSVTSISQGTTSSISMKTWSDVEVLVTYGSIGLILSFCLVSWCNLLSLQDKTVKNLGLHVTRARVIISAVAVLLAAVATSIAGIIAFVGLLIPHIARQFVGSDYRVLIPFSALSGALLILTADTLGRTIVAPNEIPASIIMAVIGGPFLIYLLRKSDRIYGI
ncbi:FecCD family ABC transporter permease [Caldalkalibacillus mannanilyticus]|uniref:FecCD family ABC transporter permease n=1 Tax=Caldalkalibacillus mannanilyticus TaxID=1418 RepID=UPI0004699517|nr:iron ABC transporter permease [Caldalkalibacillus mannanilyticus]